MLMTKNVNLQYITYDIDSSCEDVKHAALESNCPLKKGSQVGQVRQLNVEP